MFSTLFGQVKEIKKPAMKIKLDPLDLNFLNLDTITTRQVVASYCLLDKCPDFTQLKLRMENVVNLFPRLKLKLLSSSKPSWIPANDFNLDDHLQYIHNPSINSLQQLHKIAEEIFTAGVDQQKPLWKFTLISNHQFNSLSQNPYAAIIFIVHHALADGLGGLEILNALSDSSVNTSQFAETELAHSQKHKHRYFSSPKLNLINKLSAMLSIFRELCSARPKSLLNGINSNTRAFLFFDLNLNELKIAKKHLHCSLNHLFLTLITSAIRSFHEKNRFKIKSLRAIIPVNLRPTGARHQLGNHLTGVGLMLPTGKLIIKNQLELIIRQLNQIHSSRKYGVYYVLGRINALMPIKIQPLLCKYQAGKTNFICTNVPGPRKPQFLAGAEIKKNYCIPALMHGHGVGFSIFTYTESAHFCVVFDPNILKNPELLEAELMEATNNLTHQRLNQE